MTSVFANPQFEGGTRRLLPHVSGRILERMAASPESLRPVAKGIPGIHQGTPARIEVNRSSDLARSKTAALPTFHHDHRDASALSLRYG